MVSLLMQAMQQYFDKHGPHTCSWPFLLAQPTGTFSKADCYMAPFVGHSTVYHRRQAYVDQKPLYLCLILLTRSLLPARRPNSL
ncbi:Poly [ADP-ribose] polymerase 2 [Fusarium oxysporum f. sp. albedinis]|nr:Poly [ADP-ribose] polymerase 2 [Fusarium oxysporum f. sp. albedinis]